MSNNDKKLDVISGIDEKIIDKCTRRKIALLTKLKIRTKRIIALTTSASILCASFLTAFIVIWFNQVPVYTGMTLSRTNPMKKIADAGDEVILLSTNGMADMYHDVMDSRTRILLDNDKGNDQSQNNGKDTFNAQGTKDIFYCKPNQDFYITVHIDNPKNYEILSFTLNGKKYSSYMFEEGSDMENLVLKCNVGEDAYGIVEYTIDAIKYIDGTSIKDVRLKGDKTIRVGVYNEYAKPTANISDVRAEYTSIKADIKITDNNDALSYGKYELYAELVYGGQILASKKLSLGNNEDVTFDGLNDGTAYKIQVVAHYDNFDGKGYGRHVLGGSTNAVTESMLTVSITDTSFDSVSYSITKVEGFESVKVNKVYVTLDDKARTPVNNTTVSGQTISGLYSNNAYILCVDYTIDGVDIIKEVEFATPDRANVVIEPKNAKYGLTSVSFELNVKNPDGAICKITKVGIYKDSKLIASLPASEKYVFDNLAVVQIYTVCVEYTVDKIDGKEPSYDKIQFSVVTQSEGLEIKDGKVVGIGSCKDSIVYVNMPTESDAFDYCSNIMAVVAGQNAGSLALISCYDLRYYFSSGGSDEAYGSTIKYGRSDFDNTNAEYEEEGKGYYVDPSWLEKTFTKDKNGYVTTMLKDGRKALVAYFGNSDNIVIPEGVNVIMPGVFYGMEIESVKMPSSVTEIGSYAFAYCEYLKTVEWSPSLTRIGSGAFSACVSLENIIVPDGITELENSVFSECWNVKTLVLSKNLKVIGERALHIVYDNYSSQKMVILPSTVERIGTSGLHGMSVFVPKSVKTVGESAFSYCKVYMEIAEMPSSWRKSIFGVETSVVWGYKLK